MKKDDKQKKQPEAKNVLLQTYFTSLLSLVLCVCMFMGTSYAWFTSEVNNEGNEIYIGTLDVEMEKKVPDGDDADADPDYVSLSELTTGGVNKTKLFESGICWEPGYTALETIRIMDKGDLAFKYNLNFADGVISANDVTGDREQLLAVAEHFDVWVYSHGESGAPTLEEYGDITATESGWVWAGSLKELLSGKPVLSGEMNEADVLAAAPVAHTYTIALHMKETAGSEDLMGQKIGLNVKLVAYQMGSEQDGFGGAEYDTVVAVASAEEFMSALTAPAGGSILMVDDIELPVDADKLEVTGDVHLDMNGKKLTMHREAGASIRVDCTGSLTISGNGVMEKTSHESNMFYVAGKLIILDGTYRFAPYNWGLTTGGCGTSTADCHCANENNHHCNNLQKLGTLINSCWDESNVKYRGSVKIYGGCFDTGIKNLSSAKERDYMFAMLNCDSDSNKHSITVYGGTFVGTDPRYGDVNYNGTDPEVKYFLAGQTSDTCPNGYTVVKGAANDGTGRVTYTYSYSAS